VTLQYRKIRDFDVAAIARIHRRACRIAYAFMNWSYSERECRLWYESKFREWDWGLVVDDDGVPVGFIAVAGRHLDQLFVDPCYQSRGIGAHLLEAACARNPGIATLHVFEQNIRAREFYERHGFREVGRFLNEQERAIELIYRRG
jgi:ribosomal protein S18 acetylase RimI-like enzyme